MICKNCGKEIEENNKFCAMCGSAVEVQEAQENQASTDEVLEVSAENREAPAAEKPAQPQVQKPKAANIQDTMVYTPGAYPSSVAAVKPEDTKKNKKGLSAVGAILIPAIILLIVSMLLSWNTAIIKLSPEYSEDVELKASYVTVFDMYNDSDSMLEYIDDAIENEDKLISRGNREVRYYNHYLDVREALIILNVLSMIASIAILAVFALLFVSVILFTKEIRAGKIFSIIAGIIMFIVSAVYAAAMPVMSELYSTAVELEAIWGVYVTLGLSLVITILSIFYKKKSK